MGLLPANAYDAACEGTDFYRNNGALWGTDLSSAAVLPDEWLACGDACKLDWARRWVRAFYWQPSLSVLCSVFLTYTTRCVHVLLPGKMRSEGDVYSLPSTVQGVDSAVQAQL